MTLPGRSIDPAAAFHLLSLSWTAFGGTHQGRVRPINEDRFLVRQASGVFAVADGMGGHAHGDVASSAIVAEMADVPLPEGWEARIGALAGAIDRANGAIRDFARERGATVGSTVVALSLQGVRASVLWCGDSRAYRVAAGSADRLTHDHALGSEGLLHAVGIDPHPHLERVDIELSGDETFVLCSDGLTAHVRDEEIAALAGHAEPEAACRALVRLALERGGTDNVTVIVVAPGRARAGSARGE